MLASTRKHLSIHFHSFLVIWLENIQPAIGHTQSFVHHVSRNSMTGVCFLFNNFFTVLQTLDKLRTILKKISTLQLPWCVYRKLCDRQAEIWQGWPEGDFPPILWNSNIEKHIFQKKLSKKIVDDYSHQWNVGAWHYFIQQQNVAVENHIWRARISKMKAIINRGALFSASKKLRRILADNVSGHLHFFCLIGFVHSSFCGVCMTCFWGSDEAKSVVWFQVFDKILSTSLFWNSMQLDF